MSDISSTFPQWLAKARSERHLRDVVQVLFQRERTREDARNSSRKENNPPRSLGHRLISSIIPSNDLVDHYSVRVGCLPDNQQSNRYLYIEPYDRTRVIVGQPAEPTDGRYLNASWVRELFGGNWWIATQAPLPHTAHAFLSVILQPLTRPPTDLHHGTASSPFSRVRTVVQLTQNFESGRQKAHAYFPSHVGESQLITPEPGCDAPPLKVTLKESRNLDELRCIHSTVSIVPVSSSSEDIHEPVVFIHLLYGAWKDHSVPEPEDISSLLSFARLVDKTNKQPSTQTNGGHLDPEPPIMVNCSAGIGRTGSFIALSSLLRAHNLLSPKFSMLSNVTLPTALPPPPRSPLGPLPNSLRDDLVAQEVDFLREQRPGMVQKEEQIALIYELLALALEEIGQTSADLDG